MRKISLSGANSTTENGIKVVINYNIYNNDKVETLFQEWIIIRFENAS